MAKIDPNEVIGTDARGWRITRHKAAITARNWDLFQVRGMIPRIIMFYKKYNLKTGDIEADLGILERAIINSVKPKTSGKKTKPFNVNRKAKETKLVAQ